MKASPEDKRKRGRAHYHQWNEKLHDKGGRRVSTYLDAAGTRDFNALQAARKYKSQSDLIGAALRALVLRLEIDALKGTHEHL